MDNAIDLVIRVKAKDERAASLNAILTNKKNEGKYRTLSAAAEAIILEYGDFKNSKNG